MLNYAYLPLSSKRKGATYRTNLPITLLSCQRVVIVICIKRFKSGGTGVEIHNIQIVFVRLATRQGAEKWSEGYKTSLL